jgi:hypothetical protein
MEIRADKGAKYLFINREVFLAAGYSYVGKGLATYVLIHVQHLGGGKRWVA